VVALGRCPGRIVHTRSGIGVRDAHLGLEPVRVSEEEAEDVAEVGDEAVGGAATDEPTPDLVERLEGGCFERQVVEATATEHRHLSLVLGVVGELEHVELSHWSDPQDGQLEAVPFLEHLVRRVEDPDVELDEALGITREDCDMIDPAQQHPFSLSVGLPGEARRADEMTIRDTDVEELIDVLDRGREAWISGDLGVEPGLDAEQDPDMTIRSVGG
jgi:hypothetical protein